MYKHKLVRRHSEMKRNARVKRSINPLKRHRKNNLRLVVDYDV